MPSSVTAETVLGHFEHRWEELLHHISPANAQDPAFRVPLRIIYIGAALALLSGGVTLLDRDQAQRLGDALAEESLEIMLRFLQSQKSAKGPVQ